MWDVAIIGGGATGLGCAVDAASRGYSTILFEQADFAKATSSRSTKLIHGGIRYLQQGDLPLVWEGLTERGRLCRNAPHLITHRPFLIPCSRWWERPFYTAGTLLYDLLAGRLGIERSSSIGRDEAIARVPPIRQEGLRGGVIYYDGQFDDARLAITLARTAASYGAELHSYTPVRGLIKENGKIAGVETDKGAYRARVVINASGIFSDDVRALDTQGVAPKQMQLSRGTHLVFPKHFFPGDTAVIIPKTRDGRVVFFVPWHDRLLVGTTDVAADAPSLEPTPTESEVDFLLESLRDFLTPAPTRDDILSQFAGLRPLVSKNPTGNTKKLARTHVITHSHSGLITIAGGKWTTYRRMAEEGVDAAVASTGLHKTACRTRDMPLIGADASLDPLDHWSRYGSEASAVKALGMTPLSPHLPYTEGEVIWAARHEYATSLEDVLARRTRALLEDARASLEIAPRACHLLAKELGYDTAWEKAQLESYRSLASNYLPLLRAYPPIF
jgi:glycerol-3-phosphate dehydrogenase